MKTRKKFCGVDIVAEGTFWNFVMVNSAYYSPLCLNISLKRFISVRNSQTESRHPSFSLQLLKLEKALLRRGHFVAEGTFDNCHPWGTDLSYPYLTSILNDSSCRPLNLKKVPSALSNLKRSNGLLKCIAEGTLF